MFLIDYYFIDSFIDLFFCKLATHPLRDTAIHIDVDEDVTQSVEVKFTQSRQWPYF